MQNPFQATSLLNSRMPIDLCQQIHFDALRISSSHRVGGFEIPNNIDVYDNRQLARRYGWSALIAHPADVEVLFSELTLALYEAIRTLYCSRTARTISMVWQILTAYARAVDRTPLAYETVWSVCVHLAKKRRDYTEITVEQLPTQWQLSVLPTRVRVRTSPDNEFIATIVSVLDSVTNNVLAFRVASQDQHSITARLALYDAICHQRISSTSDAVGVQWFIPQSLKSTMAIAESLHDACAALSIPLVDSNDTLEPSVSVEWDQSLRERVLALPHFVALFDNYLTKVHGYGPLGVYEQKRREYAGLKGFNADPTDIFPLLRTLLPMQQSRIHKGYVELSCLHYEHDLLPFWEEAVVNIRRSESNEASAWIYLGEDVLCKAMARELRRLDGTYRHSRVGR